MPREARETRIHTSLLAAAEKRLLIRMAARLPQWVGSDHLTALGALAMVAAGGCYALGPRWPAALLLAVAMLAVNWFGDSLDGTLARVRRHERPRYGFYVDHVLDIAGTTLLLGGLALSGYMTPLVAVGVLAAYLLVAAEVFLATAVGCAFHMSFLAVGPTELRILLSVGALALLVRPEVSPFGLGPFLLFDVGGVVAIPGLLAVMAISAMRNTRALYRAEPSGRRRDS
jgi:phosphatidylglycerophosphate synthase